MKNLFLTISAQLSTVSAIKWIDLDNGQTDNAERPSLKYPAALVRISFPNPEELGGGSQLVNANIQVRLVFDATNGRTSQASTEAARERSLAYLTTADDVFKSLQGFETETYSALERTEQVPEPRSDGLAIVRFTFKTMFHYFA